MRMVPAPKVAPLAQRLSAAEADTGPAVPVTLWPATQLTAQEIAARAEALPFSHIQDRIGLRGLQRILTALAGFAGDGWQQRWLSSGCDDAGSSWPLALGDPWAGRSETTRIEQSRGGLAALLCLDVIRPGYGWLHTTRLSTTYQTVRELRDPEFVGLVDDYCRAQRFPIQMIRRGLLVVSKIMLHTGRPAAEIGAADLVAYYHATWRLRKKVDGVDLAWDLLQRFGGIPAEALPFREAVRSGPMSTSAMVQFYQLQCAPVADLLTRYLDERATTLDYASLRQLAYKLAGVFWQDLELHHPGIDSLDLPAEVATGWKKRVMGSRTDPWPILIAVRAFYLDIAHWATHDAYWAGWAARCPVSVHDTRGDGKHRKHVRARLHQKVRSLTPHLPMLLRSADQQTHFQTQLLAAAQQTELGATFSFHGRDYQHMQLRSSVGAGRRGTYPGTGRTWLIDLETGQRIDQTQREDFTFWGWAGLNTFYYTGMRMEELSELTSTALFTYRLPDTAETLPLLQIAPSKSDSERVLLIPPELAHVLARVKQRIRGHSGTIPLVVRYDIYERTTTAPMPFLFQRQHGTQRRVISANTLADMITQLINHAGLTGLDGQPLHLTPHDFRRVFATEAVAGGLPIHIVAKLLGHESLTTTETYTAVYPQDVIRHYRSFITHRRSLRPSEEYRQPTSTEWEEFHQHFHKRKVELGTCGRGYGTPCQHEHACIRCPMLRPDPAQRHRLEEIKANLEQRLAEARQHGWLGEVEGLEISITNADDKLRQMSNLVSLGLPTTTAERNRL